MNKNSDGKFIERLTSRGSEQIDGIHYDSTSINAPVDNVISIRLVMTFLLVENYEVNLVDVNGTFLYGNMELDKEECYMYVHNCMAHI